MRPAAPNHRERPSETTVAFVLVGLVLSLVAFVAPRTATAQSQPRLSEAVSVNSNGLVDAYGSTSDWIEIYNAGDQPVDLAGWGLSDDPGAPLRWLFPAGVNLGAGDYLIVFASGEVSVGGELHAGFSLSGDGESLSLAQPNGAVVSTLTVPALLPDHSYGVSPAGGLSIYATPTPGAANEGGAAGILEDPLVTPGRGFFTNATQVTISHPDVGATLRYTLDGRSPTAATGTVYAGPITVDETTTLRVGAFRGGWISDRPVTHTYVFADQVPDEPAMHASRVDEAGERQAVVNGVLDQPTISIVTDQGINQVNRVATSVEWIDPDGGDGFQVDAGIQEVGGTSVRYPKDSWRLAFDGDWGESSLEFPVFDGFPTEADVEPTDRFKRLTLRMGAHDTLFYAGSGFVHRQTWIKNRYGDETMLELGHVNAHGRWVNVFLNGEYWGQYHLRENLDDHFMAEYLRRRQRRLRRLEPGSHLLGRRRLVGRSGCGGVVVDELARARESGQLHRLDDPERVPGQLLGSAGAPELARCGPVGRRGRPWLHLPRFRPGHHARISGPGYELSRASCELEQLVGREAPRVHHTAERSCPGLAAR